MNLSIRKSPVDPAKENTVFLSAPKPALSGTLSKQERAYVEKQLKEEKKAVELNRYGNWVFIQVLEGAGDAHKSLEAARKAGDRLGSRLNALKAEEVTVVDGGVSGALVLAFLEGLMLGSYQFLKYRKDADKEANTLASVKVEGKVLGAKDLEMLKIVVDATFRARNLVNEPVISLTATQLAKEFQQMGKEAGFEVEVLNKVKIESLKMGGLLAVNYGSVEPPTFTIMEWKPKKAVNKKPVVLVGKGVVYDTGGLSLKPTPNSMDTMKCDMAGAAAVGCAMYAVALAKLPVHVIALVPATDNRPGGNAYTPGDVVKMHSGLTVEVLNTDAEGRMILADALSYAKKYKPELVLDFATLTGAAVAAIGSYGIVCMGNAGEEVKGRLKESGSRVHERLVEFPFWDDYDELIKSDIADMKNIGGPNGGAITAGKFLARFVDYPWMHFDIAGPAFLKGGDSYRGKNGTGVGVRLLFDYFKNLAGSK
jgi:leucyl aminopeptidase